MNARSNWVHCNERYSFQNAFHLPSSEGILSVIEAKFRECINFHASVETALGIYALLMYLPCNANSSPGSCTSTEKVEKNDLWSWCYCSNHVVGNSVLDSGFGKHVCLNKLIHFNLLLVIRQLINWVQTLWKEKSGFYPLPTINTNHLNISVEIPQISSNFWQLVES